VEQQKSNTSVPNMELHGEVGLKLKDNVLQKVLLYVGTQAWFYVSVTGNKTKHTIFVCQTRATL
jgi:hypothetical protein